MPYLSTLHDYLHQSSLLLQAYPTTTRITTKYSLPRKAKKSTKPAPPPSTDAAASLATAAREPSATLTLKTFEPATGICLKYRTEKAAEVGRLVQGLGRLAAGEVVEMPQVGQAQDKMDVDVADSGPVETAPAPVSVPVEESKAAGGKGKKKKGKK